MKNQMINRYSSTVAVLFCFCQSIMAGGNVTYDFENIGNNGTSFSSSGQTFTVIPELIGINIATFGSEIIGGADVSDGYLDTGFNVPTSGNVGGINAPTGMTFRAKAFDVWPSENDGGAVLPAGTVVRVLGFRNGGQVISADVATFDYGQPTNVDVRWARIDLTGTLFNSTNIDSVQFELIGSQDYIAVDNFVYSDLQSANNLPTISGTAANQAVNDDATISLFQNVQLAEPDGENVSLTVSLDDNAKGVFTSASLATSGFTGTGPYNLSSRAAAAAQTAIRALVYNPSDDRVSPGLTETTVFNIASNDGVGTANNNMTSVISTSIDQPPVAVADAFTVIEDAASMNLDVLDNDTDVDGGPLEIIAITQSLNGSVSNNTSDVSYQPDADYCNDGQTTDDFTYATNGPSGTLVEVTVTCVNDAPSFTVMGDIDATGLVDENDTEIQITGYVENISFGPANESSQGVLGFFPNCTDPDGVVDLIVVDAQGKLTLDFTLNFGVAVCQLTMLDTGGTNNNGQNTSASVEFSVSLTDIIFADGFEPIAGAFNKQMEHWLEVGYKGKLVGFDDINNTVFYMGHQLQISNQLNTVASLNQIVNWLARISEIESQ